MAVSRHQLSAFIIKYLMNNKNGFTQKIPVDFDDFACKRHRNLDILAERFNAAIHLFEIAQVQTFMGRSPGPLFIPPFFHGIKEHSRKEMPLLNIIQVRPVVGRQIFQEPAFKVD